MAEVDDQTTQNAPEAPKVDDFTAVFDALNKLGDSAPPADLTSKPAEAAAAVDAALAEADKKPAAKPETPANPVVSDGNATDDELPEDDKAKAERETAEAEAAAAEAKKQTQPRQTQEQQVDDDEILRRLGRLIKEPPAERQPAQQQTPQIQFGYNDEERQLVDEYEKEWPDVARAEATKRALEYKLLTQHIFTEVVKMVAPLVEGQRVLMDRTQLADLQASVENYDEKLVNDVAEWVKTQPAYLQTAYTHVMREGTVDEVKDLVDRYRASTGTPAPKQEGQTETKPSGSELPTPAKQAAARLAPVSTKRSAPVQAPSKDDFDGAFAEAAKEA